MTRIWTLPAPLQDELDRVDDGFLVRLEPTDEAEEGMDLLELDETERRLYVLSLHYEGQEHMARFRATQSRSDDLNAKFRDEADEAAEKAGRMNGLLTAFFCARNGLRHVKGIKVMKGWKVIVATSGQRITGGGAEPAF